MLSALATGASWLCYYRALQLGPASKVAPVDKLGVVFAVVLAFVFLGEQPAPKTIAGTVLIVVGAGLRMQDDDVGELEPAQLVGQVEHV